MSGSSTCVVPCREVGDLVLVESDTPCLEFQHVVKSCPSCLDVERVREVLVVSDPAGRGTSEHGESDVCDYFEVACPAAYLVPCFDLFLFYVASWLLLIAAGMHVLLI